MYNIRYQNRQLSSQIGHLLDIGRPFANKIDRKVRKSSIDYLLVSPDDTRKCSQIKRFIVPFSPRYAYTMHVTYRDAIKCQAVYEIENSFDKTFLFRAFNYITHNIDQFDDLEKNLLSIIRLLALSWTFDGVLTDIPWLTEDKVGLPVTNAEWNLTSYEADTNLGKAMNMVLNQFGKIPLNTLTFDQIKDLTLNQTDVPQVSYRCPLILMKTNSTYAGWLASQIDRGLPVVLFKLSRIV